MLEKERNTKKSQDECSYPSKKTFVIPEVVEVDISKLDNVLTCACSADDTNPY